MDNGSGVVGGATLVDDRPSESKIDAEFPSDVSGLKDSEGDEDFEEAEEASLDDDANSLKDNPNDAIASMSSHIAVQGVSLEDGMLAEQHEDEVMQDAMAVPAADEYKAHPLGGDNSKAVSVANVNDNGGMKDEVILVNDERRIQNEDSAEEQRFAASAKHEETSVEDKEPSQQKDNGSGDAAPVQELMADEKLEEGDAEKMGHNEPDADQLRTSDGSIAHEHIDEISGGLTGKASPDNFSGDQNHIRKAFEDRLAGERKYIGSVNAEDAKPASDANQQNGAVSLDASDDFDAQRHANGEHVSAPSEQKERDGEMEDTVHEEITLVESNLLASEAETSNSSGVSTTSENKEPEVLERQHTADLVQSVHENAHNGSAPAEATVKGGEAAHEGMLSGQASREKEPKPVSTSVSSSSTEQSSNPVLRPAGLGRAAALEHAPRETEPKPALSSIPSSSLEKSPNLDLHPAGLGSGAAMLKPAPGETEPKPASSTAISSSSMEKSPNPGLHPAGLGSGAAMLKPAPGETEPKPASTSVSSSSMEKSPNAGLRPAGLGRAAPLLEPASRVVQQPRSNGAVSQMQSQLAEDMGNGEVEEGDETREKLQMIRVKFLRLAHRLGQTPHNVVVAQVLYRLGLAEQLRGRTGGRTGGAFSYDRASAMAEQLEQTGKEPLDFSCTIMVLGKTGVGKSATINSIFDEVKFNTDAFSLGTKKVQDVEGTVQGIKVRIIDTPGLLSSWSEQRKNERILHSVKQFIKKTPPDIVLYLDRLDMPSRDFSDMPLLRTITDIFGPSIWFNAIVVLTHAASAPPEGPNGTATTYDMFVTQRSHAVQQAIRQAAGDMRLMNPVSLVENHSACRTNRAGQRVLPNGQVWKPHLLLLSFASKILAEANALLKLQDTPPGKPFPARSRAPPLPFLLSSLLQSRSQLKLPDEQFGDDDAFDEDLDDSSGSDEESEYDELPPFRRLTKAQLARLTKQQRKEYNDELEYRERLFMKKQLKEEKRRRKMMKKMAEAARDIPGEDGDNVEEESSSAASVPVPMPDLALPASFDADNPTHRYRYLDSTNQWLIRPVLDAHGWDHDVGYEGINVERLFVVKEKVPVSFSGQVSKDKKEATLQMEVASSIKHGEGKGTTLGFDMQSVGKDMAYTLRSETRFSNYKHNKATAGLSFSLLGDAMTAGLKFEDKLVVNKQFRMVMSGGAMTGRGDTAYGGSLEATLRDKDYPLGRFHSSLGLSVMDWHGDLAIGCNIQSQIPVGRSTNLIGRANLNNRGSGQVSLRLNSSEQIQLALIGLIPLVKKVMGQYSSQQY